MRKTLILIPKSAKPITHITLYFIDGKKEVVEAQSYKEAIAKIKLSTAKLGHLWMYYENKDNTWKFDKKLKTWVKK